MEGEEIKVSELPEASSFENDDIVMIVQNGANKKIKKEKLNFLEFELDDEWQKGEKDD